LSLVGDSAQVLSFSPSVPFFFSPVEANGDSDGEWKFEHRQKLSFAAAEK
jgi:hypothetical protein